MSAAPFAVSSLWPPAGGIIGPQLGPPVPAQHSGPVLPVSSRFTASPAQPAEPFAHFQSLADLKGYLLAAAVQQYQSLFGTSVPGYSPYSPGMVFNPGGLAINAVPLAVTSDSLTNAPAASTYSGTNTQVAGVEEADLMETDGNYLYMISQGELVIVDVRDVDHPSIAARVKLQAPVSSMYLSGDRLTLISAGHGYTDAPGLFQVNTGLAGLYQMSCLYSNPAKTTVTVLDVSDRSAPKIAEQTEFDGSLIDSRAVGSQLYLVLQDTGSLPLPAPIIVHNNVWPTINGNANQDGSDYRYETEQEYLARISGTWQTALPDYTSYDAEGNVVASGLIADASQIYKPAAPGDWESLTTVAVIDMASNKAGPSDAISLPTGDSPIVYASTTSLYLLVAGSGTGTTIDKIDLVAAALERSEPKFDSIGKSPAMEEKIRGSRKQERMKTRKRIPSSPIRAIRRRILVHCPSIFDVFCRTRSTSHYYRLRSDLGCFPCTISLANIAAAQCASAASNRRHYDTRAAS